MFFYLSSIIIDANLTFCETRPRKMAFISHNNLDNFRIIIKRANIVAGVITELL